MLLHFLSLSKVFLSQGSVSNRYNIKINFLDRHLKSLPSFIQQTGKEIGETNLLRMTKLDV